MPHRRSPRRFENGWIGWLGKWAPSTESLPKGTKDLASAGEELDGLTMIANRG